MPTRCIDCPFMVSRDNDDCILQSDEANEKFETWEEMKRDCPLVEIKTPHGRLVDERDAYDHIAEQEGGNYVDMDAVDMGLQETPTVIEAEEDQEE